MAALEDYHKYHRVFLHLIGHSNLKQTYRVNDECQMKLIQEKPEKHSAWIHVLVHFPVLPILYKHVFLRHFCSLLITRSGLCPKL